MIAVDAEIRQWSRRRAVEVMPVSEESNFFEKAFVRRVKRRICIRIVRFWCST